MACTRGTYQPDRKPYDGFRWEHIAGAGLDFWAQTNGRLRVVTDSTLPGAVIVGIIFLTSSTCHPKFVGKERCNALMTFHEHCFADCLLVLRKVYLYCYDCLCERQHFVDAHPDL